MSKVQEAIDRFDALTRKYAAFGASDTEPRAEFAEMLERLIVGDKPQVPIGAKNWQLFSDMHGVGTAAYALSVSARQVVVAAKEDPAGLREAFKARHGYLP